MTVLSMAGKPLDWLKISRMSLEDAIRMPVMWSQRDQSGDVIYDCLYSIAQLDWMNAKALLKFGARMDIIQPMNNKGVSASQGTHDYGFCRDWWILGMPRTKATGLIINRWARFECFTADWLRTPEQHFTYHQHGFPYPPDGFHFPVEVGEYVDGGLSLTGHVYTSSQLSDSWQNALGLKGQHDSGDDPDPWPTQSKRRANLFDLKKYIQNEVEKMVLSPKDWDKDDWDAVKEFLETEPMIDIKNPNGTVKKTVSITDAIQRTTNG